VVAVTVTVKDPLAEAVQERVELPEPPVMEVGVRLQDSPVVGDTVCVRLTVSVSPLIGAIVIVDDCGDPTFPSKLDGLAVTVKSSTVKIAVAEWESVPLVPVTVNMYVPATLELHETVAVPGAVKLLGEIEAQLRPDGTVSVRVTVPLNPLRELTVIDEVAGIVASTGPGVVAVMLKSVIVIVAVALWDRVPLAPDTVIT
jgi:hypothetical protein